MAVRQGGADPESNNRLKEVIAKAKAANMPNDKIAAALKRHPGPNDTENYEEIVYEG